ncbi:MAG TPA: hypothetical protein VJ505_10680 [Holophagaceae bacterium]|nr:hypothetical protein [Holophagaceae bacterium]
MRWLLLLPITAALMAQNPIVVRSTDLDRKSIDLTLYHPYSGESGSHQGFGLLREIRRMRVPRGRFTLRWEGLPKEVTEESAQLEQVFGRSRLTALEQNYDRNLISPASILEASLGAAVQIQQGRADLRDGTLKSLPTDGDDGLVIGTREGLESSSRNALRFPHLPSGLAPEPTLSMVMDSEDEGEVELRLTLLIERVKWTAHYNLEVDANLTRARLEGFALIENRSGMTFDRVRLALVAGPVNRAWRDIPSPPPKHWGPTPAQAVVEVVASAAVEPLGEAHLFHWNPPFTLGGMQTKQVALLSRGEVRVEPSVRCNAAIGEGWSEEDFADVHAYVALKVLNRREDANAGPWPEGDWRIHLPTPQGVPLLIEETASSIPLGEFQEFMSGPIRVHGRSALVETHRPLWGRYSRMETWEVELEREGTQSILIPAFLRVAAFGDQVVSGPKCLEKVEEWAHRMPIDLNQNPKQVLQFIVRYPKRPSP